MRNDYSQGCQSAVALWATGRRRGYFLTSKSADVACMTGRACKARCFAASVEDRPERGLHCCPCPLLGSTHDRKRARAQCGAQSAVEMVSVARRLDGLIPGAKILAGRRAAMAGTECCVFCLSTGSAGSPKIPQTFSPLSCAPNIPQSPISAQTFPNIFLGLVVPIYAKRLDFTEVVANN